jgi:hypothetical protein
MICANQSNKLSKILKSLFEKRFTGHLIKVVGNRRNPSYPEMTIEAVIAAVQSLSNPWKQSSFLVNP